MKNGFGKDRVQATLKSYSAALQKRTPRGLRLGVAVEELEIGRASCRERVYVLV